MVKNVIYFSFSILFSLHSHCLIWVVTWLVTFNGVIRILKRNVMPSSEAMFLVIVWELWSEEILFCKQENWKSYISLRWTKVRTLFKISIWTNLFWFVECCRWHEKLFLFILASQNYISKPLKIQVKAQNSCQSKCKITCFQCSCWLLVNLFTGIFLKIASQYKDLN